MDGEPIAAPRNAPLELKLKIMLRNWSYPEFREILYKEARDGEDHKYSSIYKRLYAYLRALELRGQDLSYNKIRETIKDEIGFTLSSSVLPYWLTGQGTLLTRMTVFDVHQPEVGFVLGLILSDGHERQRYCKGRLCGVELMFYNKDEVLIEEFKEANYKLGISVYQRFEHGVWTVRATSTLLYLLLKRYDEFILRAPVDVQLTFLKGLWLGDGHVGRNIQFCNTDPKHIKTVSVLLRMHGIEHTVEGPYSPSGRGKKPMCCVYVRGRSRGSFLKLTGLAESPFHA